MTPEQQDIYDVQMDLGEAFGVNGGASVWDCYLPPTGKGITSTPVLVRDETRRLYIRPEKLQAWGQPLPPQPVGVIPYRMAGFEGEDIRAGMVMVNGLLAFTIGTLDALQGWPSGLVVKCEVPAVVISSGFRSPLFIMGMGAIPVNGGGFGSPLFILGMGA